MSEIIGRFYFKLTENGNLLGEYSNNKSERCDVEAARRTSEIPVASESTTGLGFIGEYSSVWTEGENVVEFATLEIKKDLKKPETFSLSWKKDRQSRFSGQGMLVDGILIGDYQSE